MTPERFGHLVTYFCDNVVTVDGDYLRAVEEEAKADLVAMRQPITADALTAAGWKKRSPNTDYWWSKDMVSITNDKGTGGSGRWTFYLYESRTGVTRCHPENMYDLTELVRLLGGSAGRRERR